MENVPDTAATTDEEQDAQEFRKQLCLTAWAIIDTLRSVEFTYGPLPRGYFVVADRPDHEALLATNLQGDDRKNNLAQDDCDRAFLHAFYADLRAGLLGDIEQFANNQPSERDEIYTLADLADSVTELREDFMRSMGFDPDDFERMAAEEDDEE